MEEITPFLMDRLPGLGEGFYLFSWSATQDVPRKMGEISHVEVYRAPVQFSFNAYVVEAMGFIASVKRRKAVWIDGVDVNKDKDGFPTYKVRGGTCFVVEGQ